MSVKTFKVIYALSHILVIKEVLSPSNYIIPILSVYAVLTVVLNAIHIKEEEEESMKYIKREI